MIVTCVKCGKNFDDEFRDTGCPHGTFLANDGRNNFRYYPESVGPPPITKEAVDHPKHYGGADNPYEVIKVLEAWLTPEEFRGFLKGNVIKYLPRAGHKGNPHQDHEKAAWYQNYLVDWENRLAAAQVNKVRG